MKLRRWGSGSGGLGAALLEGAAVAREEESRCPGCHWVLGQGWMLLGTPKKVGRGQELDGTQSHDTYQEKDLTCS